MKILEILGLLVSCAAMLKLSWDVYSNFTRLTSDKWLYFYFFAAVLAKNSRIFTQGKYLLLVSL